MAARRLFPGQHAFYGIDYRLSLRINFNIYPVAPFFGAQRRALQRFRNQVYPKTVRRDLPTVRLIPSTPIYPL
jgi:hypothetical protein